MDESFMKRVLPHSVEAEQSVIGSMLMDKEAVIAASEILASTDFYHSQYGIMFESMVELLNEGKPVDLSYKEFELLAYFMENRGIALSREKILNSVWNYDYFGDARTIDTHVKKLRSKMGEKGELIKTIWGMGYKFEGE